LSYKTKVCPACRREGHKLNAVIVKTTHGSRYLKYCVCCGEDLSARFDEKSEERKNIRRNARNAVAAVSYCLSYMKSRALQAP